MAHEPTFDIFRQEADGAVVWIDFAGTLSNAIAKAQKATTPETVSCLIVNSRTGEKTVVSADEIAFSPEQNQPVGRMLPKYPRASKSST